MRYLCALLLCLVPFATQAEPNIYSELEALRATDAETATHLQELENLLEGILGEFDAFSEDLGNLDDELRDFKARLLKLEQATPAPAPTPTPEPTPTPAPTPQPTPTPTPTPSPGLVGPPALTPITQATKLNAPIVINKSGPYVLDKSYVADGTAIYVAAPNVTLDLNGHTVYYGAANRPNSYGVHSYLAWSDTGLGISIPNASEVRNLTIVNGSIVHAGSAANCHTLYGRRANNTIMTKVYAEAVGMDSATIKYDFNEPAGTVTRAVTLSQCVLVCRATASADRHMGPANVWLNEAGGECHAADNVLIGGNSGFRVGGKSELTRNVICPASHVTNGYGVWLYRNADCKITDNVILPTDGRGILFNAGENHVATGNVILALNGPNPEFGEDLNAACIRMRYEAKNIRVADNVCLAVGGSPWLGASALYLTNYAQGSANSITGNRFAAIVLSATDDKRYAKAVTFEGQALADVIDGNQFVGNGYLLSTSGSDGGSANVKVTNSRFISQTAPVAFMAFSQALAAMQPKLPMLAHPLAVQAANNSLTRVAEKVATAPAPSQRQVYAGFWNQYSDNVRLENCQVSWQPANVYLNNSNAPVTITVVDPQSSYVLKQVGGRIVRQ